MSYVAQGFTPEEEKVMLTSVKEITDWQRAEEKRRKYTLIIGGVGLLIAALKLGILVMPTVRRTQRLGRL